MKIKKSHIPVILASILLFILVATLIYVIFFMKDKNKLRENLYAKKIDDYKLEVQVANYDEDNPSLDLEHMEYENIKVSNYVNNELINSEVFTGSIKVISQKDGFILYSYSNDSFIMKTDKQFKTKWIYKFSKDGYTVKAVNAQANKIYVVIANKKNLYGTTFDSKGNKSKNYEITSIEKYNNYNVVSTKDAFVMYVEKSPVVKFNKINLDFKLESNTLELLDKHSDLIGTTLLIQGMTYKNDKVYYYIQSYYRGGTNNIIGIIDNNLNEVSFKNINDLLNNRLSSQLFNNNLYINEGKQVVIYNADTGEKITRDYSSLIEEEDEEGLVMIYVYGDEDSEILYTSGSTKYVIDVIENNKIKKSIVTKIADEQIRKVPIYLLKDNKDVYLLSNANNYSLYLNKYEF